MIVLGLRLVLVGLCFLEPCKSDAETSSGTWNYDDVDSWKEDFPKCDGKFQSPIALGKPTLVEHTAGWWLRGYSQIDEWKIDHVGNNVKLSPRRKDQTRLRVRGGRLQGEYCMDSVHFHWGKDNADEGSEHTLRGEAFPLEMHIVNYRCLYDNVAEALQHEGDRKSIAVLGFMLTDERLPYYTEFAKLVKDVEKFTEAKPNPGDSVSRQTGIDFEDLILDSMNGHFYTYSGSLTTPPCDEIVLWTVFETPIVVSDENIGRMRYLLTTTTGQTISFRPPQKEFYREISYS